MLNKKILSSSPKLIVGQ